MLPSNTFVLQQNLLSCARSALQLVRIGLHLKSTDKSKLPSWDESLENSPPHIALQYLWASSAHALGAARRSAAGHSFWAAWAKDYLSIDEIKNYAQSIRQHGAGNSAEYAVAAFNLLLTFNLRPMELVSLAPPSHHVFIVLGSSREPNKTYRPGFNHFALSTVICDPWANIACTASTYEYVWGAKMAKWQEYGKHIQVNKSYSEQAPDGQLPAALYHLSHPQKVLCSVRY